MDDIATLAKEWSGFDHLLEPIQQHLNLIPAEGNILEIGFGNNPQIVYFWNKGRNGKAIDKNKESCQKLEEVAKHLNIESEYQIIQADTLESVFIKYQNSLVIASQILHLMRPENINRLISKILDSMLPNGILYLCVASENHYGLKIMKERTHAFKEISPFTFKSNSGETFHYFQEVELINMFESHELVFGPEKFIISNEDNELNEVYQLIVKKRS